MTMTMMTTTTTTMTMVMINKFNKNSCFEEALALFLSLSLTSWGNLNGVLSYVVKYIIFTNNSNNNEAQ